MFYIFDTTEDYLICTTNSRSSALHILAVLTKRGKAVIAKTNSKEV